ncbi:cation-transporting P-type ATPase [Candidatus Collierbacteria bacterium]|nr:cation-transporting P-type ATPase [Candidatus Collierbacteria bacterium]
MIQEIGLSQKEAERRLKIFGLNEIEEKNGVNFIEILLDQVRSPLVYILILAALFSLWLNEMADFWVIMVAVLLNISLGFIQEYKAEKQLSALAKLVLPLAKVKRDGKWQTVEVGKIVGGDLVRLEMGQVVPADGVLVQEDGLFINEAILTGESRPSEKKTFAGRRQEAEDNFDQVPDQEKGYRGCLIERGIAELSVVRTGKETKMGRIAESIIKKEREITPLQTKLQKLSTMMALLVGIVAVGVILIGVAKGIEIGETLPTAVALAVAAIPEGLLVSLTVILTVGMRRILKRKALVRRLLAAETLGGVQVICLDKTGTITTGVMEAKDGVVEIGGKNNEKKLVMLAKGAVLCNDLRDPLEISMDEWARRKLRIPGGQASLDGFERMDELPFDHKYRYIVTRYREKPSHRVIEFVSGAPEVVMALSRLGKNESSRWLEEFKSLGKRGYRMVGFGHKSIKDPSFSKATESEKKIKRQEVGGYDWLGVVVFEDPVRPGVADSLRLAKEAGIEIKVITGDYKETAWATLQKVGLVGQDEEADERVVTGEELGLLSNDSGRIGSTLLFSRTSPEQKLEIVKALQDRGLSVAMTGDGVNDAPALKQADIGIVVNEASDVAKSVADMVLLDNNFGTILAAVEEGRGIFDNLRKVVLYLLADAFAGIVMIVAALILGWPLPLLASQILWINLISDGFPYMALTVEPKEEGLLKRKPLSGKEMILDSRRLLLSAVISIVAGMASLGVFGWFLYSGETLEKARTMAFGLLGVSSLMYVFSSRNLDLPLWKTKIFNNSWLILGVVGGLVLQVAAVSLPVLQGILNTNSLNMNEWVIIAVGALAVIGVIEMTKGGTRLL